MNRYKLTVFTMHTPGNQEREVFVDAETAADALTILDFDLKKSTGGAGRPIEHITRIRAVSPELGRGPLKPAPAPDGARASDNATADADA